MGYGSIICDGSIIDEIVDEFSTPIVLREVTKTFEDEYGDATENYKDYSVFVVIQSWTGNENEVKEGMFKAGTLTVTFRNSDQFLAKEGNMVKYLGDWYKIGRVFKQPLVDTLYYVYAILNKG
jgi:hypothetical protein